MKLKKWIAGTALTAGCLLSGTFPGAGMAQAEDISVIEMPVKAYDLDVRKTGEDVVFQRGVSVEGTSVEGMTVDEVKALINDYVNIRKTRAITLTVFTDNQYCYNGESFGTTWSNPELLDSVSSYTTNGNFVEQYKNQKDLDALPVDLSIDLSINESLVRDQIEALANNFHADPVNASIRREEGGFAVAAEIVGRDFDADAISSELIAMITDFDNTEQILYDLPYTETMPDYTTEDFNFSPSPLGSYSTGNLGIQNRVENIRTSANRVNGTVVYPGEEVSALALYGPQTKENGYLEAPGYENGQQVTAIGGGVCQTTSTFYNALLRAELQITQRSAHSMIVTYVPPGLDAAVAEGSKDLKFINNLNYPIYLEAYVADGQITINIWGVEERPANRRVEYVHSVESCVFPNPLYNVVVNDGICKAGPQYNVGEKIYAEVETHPDVRATSYKRVYVDEVLVEETKLNSDHYDPMVGLLYVASDCIVTNEARPSSSGYAVYRYLGWDIYHGVFFRDGAPWNPAESGAHYY